MIKCTEAGKIKSVDERHRGKVRLEDGVMERAEDGWQEGEVCTLLAQQGILRGRC